MQRAAERAVLDGIAAAHQNGHTDSHGGAAVVLDARTGGVVALASVPGFSQAAAAHDPEYLTRYVAGGGSLINRALQGVYPAGSTFKPVIAEAAMADGLIGPYSYLPCTGSYTVGDVVFHNVEAGINAVLSLTEALSISCDTWFYRVGSLMYGRLQRGDPALQRWAARLGFGRPTRIDVPGESAGFVPTPRSVKRIYGEGWYEGTSVNLAIGQGYLQITPLQLAVAYAALANGGIVVRPHLGAASSTRRATRCGDSSRGRCGSSRSSACRRSATGSTRPPTRPAARRRRCSATSPSASRARPARRRRRPAATTRGTRRGRRRAIRVRRRRPDRARRLRGEAAAPAAKEIYESLFRIRPKPPDQPTTTP